MGSLNLSRPIHVLMTADAVSGAWNVSIDLIVGLRARGIDVTLAVLGPAPTTDQVRDAVEKDVRFSHAPFRLEWLDDPWNDLESLATWLRRLEASANCDLVHLNGYTLGNIQFRGPRLIAAHACPLSWWSAVKGTTPLAYWERYRKAARNGLHGAHRVVTSSAWMRGELKQHYGLDPRFITVIPNGRSAASFGPSTKRSFVFAAGRLWDEGKNIRGLARASSGLPWPVEVAGSLSTNDGSAPVPLAAEQLGEADFLGPLAPDQMARMFAAASIYALPSRYEPFGLTVLEAALSECALVLGDIPSLREHWEGAATFVDPDDQAGLTRAMTHLIDHPDERQQAGRRARLRARAYTLEGMVDAYADVYSNMLSTPGAASLVRPSRASCLS